MKKLLLLLAVIGMIFTACTEGGVDDNINNGGNNTEQPGGENEIPDDAYITLNKEVLTFVPDGESVEVKVYSNYEWTLTNNCNWVTPSISGGEASEEGTTITLTANLAYDNREGTIIFNCGKAKKVLVASQGLKEVIISDENNTFNLPVEGGTVDIAYQATVECEVVIPSDAQHWISLAPETRGLESGCATLNIAKSKAGADRRAVVKVVKMGDQSVFAEYTINQERNMDYIIFYTTTNGETIRPYYFDYLTNTYEDGVGMLAFDGNKVTSIGISAFEGCTSLTSITIPDSVTSIGSYAFENCTSLMSITIPESVTSIGYRAFEGCTSLTSVTIPDSVTSIVAGAFEGCTSLTSITIPDSVTSIGGYAFRDCTSLTSITIPDSVTSIGDNAFEGCTSLMSITIPNSVTSIGRYAFYNCRSLTSITIPDGVTEIGVYAFSRGLTSVTIGKGLTTVKEKAFYYCSNLKSVYISDLAAWCNIDFEETNSNPLCQGGKLFINGVEATEVVIPDGVTSIKKYTFRGCTSLTSITIPDSVTSIRDNAFEGCTSLTSVTIPDSVISIGEDAFRSCTSLTSITIPVSVTWIGEWAFSFCSSLKEVYCKPTTPPSGGHSTFDNIASGRTIYVPRNSLEAYKAASGWKDYASDIVGYDF